MSPALETLPESIERDVELIQGLPSVPTILEVICRSTGMGFAAVARVTEERWVACAVRDEIAFGLAPGGELSVTTTICNDIRQSGTEIVFDEAAIDPIFCKHPTPALYGFQSYVSIPIHLSNGQFFGTLCAIDPKPAKVNTPATIGMFKLFSQLIASLIDSKVRADISEARLADEQHLAHLREQFIAVLGHDLRNPLASIASGISMLKRRASDQSDRGIAELMEKSAARMHELIDNTLDLARGQLADGLPMKRELGPLEPVIEQVVAELSTAHMDRQIHVSIRTTESVSIDRARIAQLLSNLVSNALTHGTSTSPVVVEAFTDNGVLRLSVENRGPPINPAIIDKLFQPFFRATAYANKEGLGLGLYIAHEIARGHGGKLEVTSTQDTTRFTLVMPAHDRVLR